MVCVEYIIISRSLGGNLMQTKLLEEIHQVLSTFPNYWDENLLLKNKVIDDLRNYEPNIIEKLLANALIKNSYSMTTSSGIVFKIEDFINMLRFKNYWDNSYTKFSNEIGLTTNNKYLKYNSDVVLDFPHKDGVLEGGMSDDETARTEIYYHKVLAKEEIDVMLSPKVLSGVTRFDESGKSTIESINEDDNLILRGNNLIALHTLKKKYTHKVKLIYIDPPYNTGGDSFQYNDRFNRSTWLTFMQNRLEVAAELLAEGGSIWINIDDNEVHYLKVLMDAIMPNGFVANVLWQKRTSPDARSTLGGAHDHILVYTNDVFKFKRNMNKLPLSNARRNEYKNPDNDPKGPWVSVDMTGQTGHATSSQFYSITLPSSRSVSPPDGRCWAISQSSFEKLRGENRIWFGINGDGRPRLKNYLSESEGSQAWTWWTNQEVGHNQEAKKESIALFGQNRPFSTPKPERLIQRIVTLCTNEGDLVLDFFAGSGTTPAVCHKMKRQYIAVEQMTYETDYMPERLKKVIAGEQGGISESVNWNGGGSFVYAELQQLNQQFVSEIKGADNDEDLINVLASIKEQAYLDFKIKIEKLSFENAEFSALTISEKKKMLIEIMDANQMYLSYSEIDDESYQVSESIKKLNHSFFQTQQELVNLNE